MLGSKVSTELSDCTWVLISAAHQARAVTAAADQGVLTRMEESV